MVLKSVFINTFLFAHYCLEIVQPKYYMLIDFDNQFDVPKHDHNVSYKMQKYNSHYSVDQKLFSSYGIGPRYKEGKTKSRSLSG